ncbi:MAG: sigma-54-dependent Fis family transcriptional regulator [Bdellovibrio sp.]|nr:MAG: sigma-54-dependent Fis family transcriptional regulator [Bdellovibrio sp.]
MGRLSSRIGEEMAAKRVVIVDDDHEMREMLSEFLRDNDYEVYDYDSSVKALDEMKKGMLKEKSSLGDIDLVITDLSMPEIDGLTLLDEINRLSPDLPVILITAFGSIESAIEATKKNAFDYILKPFKLNEILATIERAVKFHSLKKENKQLKRRLKGQTSENLIIGKSRAMRSVLDLIQRVAQASANVLITGESGTGKELVAQAIHQQGPRSHRPFVAINCTSIPETLLESELFGHVKGSFTGATQNKKGLFAEAEGGTIFLDEIGDLDLSLQAKLLRVLQEKKIKPVGANQYVDVDVRIIAATHKDLMKAIAEGRFREDLYYRLSVIPIVIPPLRHRREDIPLLVHFFMEKYSKANHMPSKTLTNRAMERLMACSWPGNVRELENIIERLVVLCPKDVIDMEDLPPLQVESLEHFLSQSLSDWPTLHQLEKRYIKMVLDKTGGRKEKASQILGINRRTLYRKEQEYGWCYYKRQKKVDNPEHSEPLSSVSEHRAEFL